MHGPRFFLPTLVLIVAPTLAMGATATLQWNPNVEPDVAGYKVYREPTPGVYDTTIDVGRVTRFTDPSLSDLTPYYYAVTAYNAAGESSPSNEVSFFNHPPVV